jgi:hypothetical protein
MMINRHRNHHKCSIGTALISCLTLFQAKLFESRAELELLLNLNVWDYVKPEFEKIMKEVNILIRKAKHIRRYNYITEQNLEPCARRASRILGCLRRGCKKSLS